MSYSSELTRQRIIDCAKQEFLEQGFQKANIRNIAFKAKATTGALYTHFNNKEELFDILVKEAADTLLNTFKEMHQPKKMDQMNGIPLGNAKDGKASSNDNTDWVLDYIYDHFFEFKLIFCCSEGTPYERYLESLTEIEEADYHRMFKSLSNKDVDDFFIHVMCSDGIRGLYEVVAHDIPKEQAMIFMGKVKKFRFAGWSEILGQ